MSELRDTIHNDVLKEFMVQKTYIYLPQQALRRVTVDVMGYASVNMPLFNSVRNRDIKCRRKGPKLAFTIADRLEYVRTAVEVANLEVDDIAPRLLFFWGIRKCFYGTRGGGGGEGGA